MTVTDTGVGVTEEQRSRLFSDFVQADVSTTRQFGGTGLGLVICRRLANLMGGDVTMDSAPGRGTTMCLTVPLPVGDPADLPAQTTTVSVGTRVKPSREQSLDEGSLLLFAEDHPVNRTVLGHQLDIVGFAVDFAVDGQEALEMFKAGRYGGVLTDLNMPRRDGYSLAEEIRRHEAATGAARTPIIALTANVMQGEPERCFAAGMDDFAAKPTTIPVLAAKLRRWLPDIPWTEPSATAPPATQAAGGNGLDRASLDAVTGGDAALGAAILADFLTSTRADLDALSAAVTDQDTTAVRRWAHRIKGAALVVGARTVADLAQRVEAEYESDPAATAALCERLDLALAELST